MAFLALILFHAFLYLNVKPQLREGKSKNSGEADGCGNLQRFARRPVALISQSAAGTSNLERASGHQPCAVVWPIPHFCLCLAKIRHQESPRCANPRISRLAAFSEVPRSVAESLSVLVGLTRSVHDGILARETLFQKESRKPDHDIHLIVLSPLTLSSSWPTSSGFGGGLLPERTLQHGRGFLPAGGRCRPGAGLSFLSRTWAPWN